MPTKQETFDTVVAHLRRQGRQSRSDFAGGCAYRGDGGLKCAVGVLIPDERYTPAFEGEAAHESMQVGKLLIELGHDCQLCEMLQIVHDNPEGRWELRLRELADDWGLTYTPSAAK